MNPLNIGVPSLILILILALLIFGPKKLPEIGGAFGKTLSEFKKSTSTIMDDEPENEPKEETQKATAEQSSRISS